MSDSKGRVIVIGGGVIGAACAYYLRQSGWQITIIDSGLFGSGCSHGNCGFVCPSHVLPLTEPGAIGKTLKTMFTKNSPLYVKPRFDLALWSWLFRFARRCNTGDMLEAARARHALLQSSMQLYRELFASESIHCEWQTKGLLYVFRTSSELQKYAKTDQLLRDQFDLAATRYDGRQLVELEPAVKEGLAGGWHYECDAHLRPDKLLSSWQRVLVEQGVEVHENCELKGFIRRDGRAIAIETPDGQMSADAFVVATGALTPLLNKHLGCSVPIQPGKGYSITMTRPATCPDIPVIFPEHKVAVTPMQSAFRLGSTMEFAGYDDSINRHRLDMLKESANHYLREPYGEVVEEEWFGWRPMTYDGKPMIDRCRDAENIYIAAGHNMLGLSMAPATGRLVSELVNGGSPHINPKPFSLDRF